MNRAAPAAILIAGAVGCSSSLPASPPPSTANPEKLTAIEEVSVPNARSPELVYVQREPRGGPTRVLFQATPIRLTDLPIAEIARSKPDARELAPDNVMQAISNWTVMGSRERQLTLRVMNAPVGMIGVGPLGWGAGPYQAMTPTTFLRCFDSDEIMPARWLTLRRAGEDAVDLVVTAGAFSSSQCKLTMTSRTVARATLLLADAELYAFRTCAADCEDGEGLVLVFPQTGAFVSDGVPDRLREVGSFSVVTVPMRKGGGTSVFTEVSLRAVRELRTTLGIERGDDGEADFLTVYRLGVEVVQGVADRAPAATLFASVGPPVMPSVSIEAIGPRGPKRQLASAPSPKSSTCKCAPGDPLCPCL